MTKVTLSKHNEILINGRSSEERGDDSHYVCDICGDIVCGVEHTKFGHNCSVCETVIKKCADCVYLYENENKVWACSHFNDICAESVFDCEM